MFSIFMGYTLGDQMSPKAFEEALSNLPDPNQLNSLELFAAIVYNNVLASFIFIVSGFLLGIPPMIFIVINGLLIGYVVSNTPQGIGFVLATILPHGIIEIPVINLSAAMGVGLGYKIIHRFMRRKGLQEYITETLKVFIKRIVPLLVLAAGIETALAYLLRVLLLV